MAGVTALPIGQQRTCTEPVEHLEGPVTASEMQAITTTEGQASRDILEAQLIELRRVVLGLVLGTESELEDPGP